MEKKSEQKDSIWLIDDSAIIHKVIKKTFPSYTLHSFYSGEELLNFVSQEKFKYPDLIILDIIMQTISGYEIIERLMENMEFREVPIIVLSTNEAIDDKVKALEMGATDYMVKPFSEKELSARVRVHIKIKKNQDALREKVILDFLTNTFNKRHLYTKLKNQFKLYDRHQYPFSIIFFDIDHFKELNDSFSHLTGDFVLKELCSEIRNIIRGEDELFRYGGEEFVIIAPFTTKSNAENVAEKIRNTVKDKVFNYQENEIKITLSVGVASMPEDDIFLPDTLLEVADKRMLMAKKGGRNRVVSE